MNNEIQFATFTRCPTCRHICNFRMHATQDARASIARKLHRADAAIGYQYDSDKIYFLCCADKISASICGGPRFLSKRPPLGTSIHFLHHIFYDNGSKFLQDLYFTRSRYITDALDDRNIYFKICCIA